MLCAVGLGEQGPHHHPHLLLGSLVIKADDEPLVLTKVLGWCGSCRLVVHTEAAGLIDDVVRLPEGAHHLLHVKVLGGVLQWVKVSLGEKTWRVSRGSNQQFLD